MTGWNVARAQVGELAKAAYLGDGERRINCRWQAKCSADYLRGTLIASFAQDPVKLGAQRARASGERVGINREAEHSDALRPVRAPWRLPQCSRRTRHHVQRLAFLSLRWGPLGDGSERGWKSRRERVQWFY